MTLEMVPNCKLCLLFIVCSMIATGSSSFIDQAKSFDEALKRIDALEQRVAAFEMTGIMYYMSLCMCEPLEWHQMHVQWKTNSPNSGHAPVTDCFCGSR